MVGLGAWVILAPLILVVAYQLPAALERAWSAPLAGDAQPMATAPEPVAGVPETLSGSFISTYPAFVPASAFIAPFWLDVLMLKALLVCNIAAIYAWGLTGQGLGAVGFCGVLLTLARIDAQSGLLPDLLTIPLLWLGLFFHMWGGWITLSASVVGAATGYLLLWLIFTGLRWKTGLEGMGHGDFKLVAALGAWLGPLAIPGFLLCASLPGAFVGLWARYMGRLPRGVGIPFGPFLALAGILILFWDHAPVGR